MLVATGGIESEILAGTCLQIPFIVKPGDTISWEYAMREHDIEFSLKWRIQGDGGAIESVLLAPKKTNAHKLISTGYYHTNEHEETSGKNTPGTFILVWNNSYSWKTKKYL